jgi:putative DNA primase/helicase
MTVHTVRPANMPVQIDNIPDGLKQISQWVVWNWVEKVSTKTGKTKFDKPPKNLSGFDCDSTDPKNWSSFKAAATALDRFDGIGLAMGAEGCGLVGVDLDDCIDCETGFMSEDARQIIELLDTYAEISPSGSGVKMWLNGTYDKTGWRSKVGNIEVYKDGRYFTVTGNMVSDKPIADIGPSFFELMNTHLAVEDKPASKTGSPVEQSDDEPARIKHALNACLKVEIAEDEGDGSRRMVKYCRQCVRAGLSPEGAITAIRAIEQINPFPKEWSDSEIRKRYASALNQSDVGEAIQVYEKSDYGVAERLRDYSAGRLIWIPEWNRWLHWDGRAFVADTSGRFNAMLVAVTQLMKKENAGDEKETKAWHSFVMQYQSAKGISAVERLARGLMSKSYSELDRRIDIFHCANGVISLDHDIKKLREHNKDNLNTKYSEIPFIPDSKCPRWLRFIDEVTGGDKDLARYLQMVVGYCLTGIAAQELFILHGGGNNGKGVFTRVLIKLLGEYAGPISQDLLMASPNQHPTQFAYLYGKRAVVAQETDDDCKLNENQVKMLTGGDPIQCRRMREDFWEFEPTHKILLATNKVPIIHGSDHGIWRRIKLIPFLVTFTPDLTLETILATEMPGIFQWAIGGYSLFNMLGGFVEPDAVVNAKAEYREEMSTVAQFVEDKCELGVNNSIEASVLYQSFKMYCELHGHKVFSSRKFGNDLIPLKVTNGRTNSARTKVGIKLKEEFENVEQKV